MSINNEQLFLIRADCARVLLGSYHRAHAGHIAASLSCLEILVDLCFRRMGKEDYVVLSKGHAAMGLYTVLAKSGRMDETELKTYYAEGTRLAAHPPCSGEIPAIPFGTGSLGHGLSLSAGMVLSQRFTARPFQVFCVLSDGDCNEGSTWEAALFAAQNRLVNLTVIIDANGLQGFGYTKDVCGLEPLYEKWRSFGFTVATAADGNSFADLDTAYAELAGGSSAKPRCIIARTTKGHGVSFMEDRMEWHYLPMNEEQYVRALRETEEGHA
jgi:transketolase